MKTIIKSMLVVAIGTFWSISRADDAALATGVQKSSERTAIEKREKHAKKAAQECARSVEAHKREHRQKKGHDEEAPKSVLQNAANASAEGAKKVGHGVEAAGRGLGKGIQKSGEKLNEAVEKTGESVKHGIEKMTGHKDEEKVQHQERSSNKPNRDLNR